MAFTSAVFGSPIPGNQNTGINQIASQGKGSFLDGGVPVKLDSLTNTVTSTYGITGNQSDKLSSGHSANILAQSSAKGSAGQSAKFYAGLKYETLSRPNPDISNRGEITPFKGFIGVTTRGEIEFCQFIKKDCVEFCESIKSDRGVEFLESIKKGSVSTTLCVFDIKYRANQPLQISQRRNGGISDISGEAENFDDNHLFLSSDVRYSDRAPAKSGVRICTLNIQTATHDAPCVFFCVRAHAHLKNAVLCRPDSMVALAGQPKGWLVSVCASSANPVSVTTPIEICTSGGDSALIQTEIIVMMAIPAQTQFKFLFLAVKLADSTDIPHRIEATAPNEHCARLLLVRDYILSFAGRVPVREVAA
ncbi:host cell division inhibitor Icd-like protein [Morganella morganii]|uniref:host cell division inhibitor Icd-like protein n=1 Tax=Morganella morganii TaxID=582 RepID=UPI000BFC872E|nr:host cell division inhibitor Icd-like protein [Morganella morganii]EKU4287545.1 ash family protein [Morganella morganii]EKU4302579.1 ash family protein [Morganella morganii]EKU5663715.1 ash family protein [Morganella morganii]EKU5691059.1 ash family protein [Morganella morganii]EKU6425056.1 ash family protein [Morganella morganii]